jgi:hypothetical protein
LEEVARDVHCHISAKFDSAAKLRGVGLRKALNLVRVLYHALVQSRGIEVEAIRRRTCPDGLEYFF